MIETAPFGSTGHHSSRVIFGAAALAAMSQQRADQNLEHLLSHGINHIDTAEGYGDSELRLGAWIPPHRDKFFIATKTRRRDGDGARRDVERSLERLRIDRLDSVQLHNLVDEPGWQEAFAPGGAVEGLARARAEGLVRFIGVTGHGTFAAAMHLRSLERFDFDSVLLPYNFSMMQSPDYGADFEALVAACAARGVAVQTIKALARRRWHDVPARRFSWYEPVAEPDAIRRLVHWVLARPDMFLNTTSDARLLPAIFEAAQSAAQRPDDAAMLQDQSRLGIEPLFIRGLSDTL